MNLEGLLQIMLGFIAFFVYRSVDSCAVMVKRLIVIKAAALEVLLEGESANF